MATAPEPNPPFVFPARRAPQPRPNSLTATLNRRPMSSHDLLNRPAASEVNALKRNSVGGLPDFSFRPSSTDLEPPTPSPTSGQFIPTRPVGHRRGGSEFVGSDGQSGSDVMSTSPTKGEEGVPSPPVPAARSGPSPGRRGHAHRRSGAISCHDLNMILQPANASVSTRAGSAPASPLEMHGSQSFPKENASTQPMPKTPTKALPESPDSSNITPKESPTKSESEQTRARVEFSDTLEFIPRPLSIISSETSSTMSTVRGHSASGSISSVISGGTASPPSLKAGRPSLSTTFEEDSEAHPQRPKTAEPDLTGLKTRRSLMLGEFPTSSKRPMSVSAPSSPTTSAENSPVTLNFPPKKKHFFRNSSPRSSLSKEIREPVLLDSPPQSPKPEALPQAERIASQCSIDGHRERKASRKQKKVKSWAGSILSRKSKHRNQKHKTLGRRTPTPPLRNYSPSPITSEIIPSSRSSDDLLSAKTATLSPKPEATDFANWKPRETSPQDFESMSPVIDLDAALGPFNTPSLGPEFGSAPNGGFVAAKRRMHSSGSTGGFMGPGMHYHRRAESAPEMAAFDLSHFGLNRLASTSTMADVFEEDEEDDFEEGETPKAQDDAVEDAQDTGLGIGIQVVDADKNSQCMDWSLDEEGAFRRGIKRKGSGLSEGERRHSGMALKTESSAGSLLEEAIPEESIRSEGKGGEQALSSSPTESSDSTVTSSPHQGTSTDDPAKQTVKAATYLLPETPSSLWTSPFPSPEFSTNSCEIPRIGTATSSITDDRTLNSLLLGEPGPELRMSVDDVPSLTSSDSTTPSASHSHFPSNFLFRSSGERSASLSSARTARSGHSGHKRSSLASFSRLVSSSHGEKSKLSIEEKAQPESVEKPKDKKGKRISRMMQFWKPKDTSSS
ncbi:MAG: hypothetical protein M1819_005803 [Sarea resinae]|nr:MAG: hypothetical protein M1819_005803 [Sarea resinae]